MDPMAGAKAVSTSEHQRHHDVPDDHDVEIGWRVVGAVVMQGLVAVRAMIVRPSGSAPKHAALAAGRATAAQAALESGPAIARCGKWMSIVMRSSAPLARHCRSFASALSCASGSARHQARDSRPILRAADRSSNRSAPATGMASTSLHRDAVAQPIGLAGRAADHRVAVLVILEIVVADGAGRNESVGAGFVKLDEQPARVTPPIRPSKLAPMRSAR